MGNLRDWKAPEPDTADLLLEPQFGVACLPSISPNFSRYVGRITTGFAVSGRLLCVSNDTQVFKGGYVLWISSTATLVILPPSVVNWWRA